MKSWQDDAACADSEIDFFSSQTTVKYDARAVCISACPVRFECLSYAIQNREIWGIWGGVDEYELRRSLSVNHLGEPVRRSRKPRCPYCSRSSLVDVLKKRARKLVRCELCGLEWWIYRPKAVTSTPENATSEEETDDD